MREIKFRGKDVVTGEWVYGCFTRYSEEKSYITHDLTKNECYEVYAGTVGQYTGLNDFNNKELFAGDCFVDEEGMLFEIVWDQDYLQWYALDILNKEWNMSLGEFIGTRIFYRDNK